MRTYHVNGKVVVVTGATGRLGRLLVEAFSREGARVAAIVHSAEDARGVTFSGDGGGRTFVADLSREPDVERCFGEIRDAFGGVDVLVHAVGTWGAKPLLETTLADWEGLLRVNLTSVFLCFREAARSMEGRNGRLIAFAAGQGVDQGRAQQGAYAAAKAGVVRLVEAAAAEFAGRGIMAHALAPSTILYEESEGQKGVRAEDLVDLCLYLCTETGDALNGKTLRAYGSAG